MTCKFTNVVYFNQYGWSNRHMGFTDEDRNEIGVDLAEYRLYTLLTNKTEVYEVYVSVSSDGLMEHYEYTFGIVPYEFDAKIYSEYLEAKMHKLASDYFRDGIRTFGSDNFDEMLEQYHVRTAGNNNSNDYHQRMLGAMENKFECKWQVESNIRFPYGWQMLQCFIERGYYKFAFTYRPHTMSGLDGLNRPKPNQTKPNQTKPN